MKSMFKFMVLGYLMCMSTAHAAFSCPTDRADYFCLTPEMAPDSIIKVADFYFTPARIISLFSPELSKLSAPILLEVNWESPYFGAGVSLYKDNFHLMILGGMARIDKMTPDAYAAIVCHEIGHMIGGFPFQTIPGAEWSSSEGQADLFAASVCLPKLFQSQGELLQKIPARVEQAGFEMLNALKDYDSNEPNATLIRFMQTKQIVPNTLINQYPNIQCRYEAFRNPLKRSECWFNK
ncbi:MAG: hypothetical protein H7177_06590 [Rhizobacter sp.]|nr:hypothetical protein [Bacteriovorax sp.]